ncbi:cytochrome c [Paenibacillus psychroresistens]|uniref:Cytochrome c n=1 Tax=Paenibacillus psychroresistens TaxID=1778678 RepID=A0A6B8RGU0_9BACL|nr:cytochrome c [Paenibacillus psychroresistens]QGQ94608.1 cytochrome c [Paenibacillus psychroresistens]
MYKWALFILLIGAFSLGIVELFVEADKHQAELAEASKPEVVSSVPLDTVAAEAVYKQSCISCHGGNLEGVAGPALINVGSLMTETKILKQITNGGGGMPPFKGAIKDDQIANLAKWLATHK